MFKFVKLLQSQFSISATKLHAFQTRLQVRDTGTKAVSMLSSSAASGMIRQRSSSIHTYQSTWLCSSCTCHGYFLGAPQERVPRLQEAIFSSRLTGTTPRRLARKRKTTETSVGDAYLNRYYQAISHLMFHAYKDHGVGQSCFMKYIYICPTVALARASLLARRLLTLRPLLTILVTLLLIDSWSEAPSVDCGLFTRDVRESVDKERRRKSPARN